MYSLYNGVSPTELEPSEFSIGQNYPNPFKEKTIIKYCVAYKTRVTLTIYNEKGEVIERLVDEEQKPGTYEVEFNSLTDHSGKSKNLLDGYYFYKMTAGDYSSEKKWLCINNLLRSNKMKSLIQTLFFFLLTTQICFGQWYLQNPLTTPNNLNDVTLVNNCAWAVGDNGIIIKSTNVGINWIEQESGVTIKLSSVSFADENNGWIVGESGTILHTTNGGAIWVTQISGTYINLQSILFVNLNIGWAVGDSGTVLHSTDSGQNWFPQISGTTINLSDVDFVDETTGWVVGEDYPFVFKTTDGGTQWLSQPVPSTGWVRDVCFVDPDNGWVIGADTEWWNSPKIWRTTNGGMTWINQAPSGFSWVFLEGLYFTDLNNGWIVGREQEIPLILKTTDGGIHWTIQYLGSFLQNLSAVHFRNNNDGIAVGSSGKILNTSNGGTDWFSPPGGCTNHLNAVCFVGNNLGWAVGDEGLIMHTSDGGSSWIPVISGTTQNISDVQFVNANIGWIVGGTEYYGPPNNFTAVVLKTIDGGLNWFQQISDTTYFLNDVFFVDENIGWAVGGGNWSASGTLLKTTNGGNNWISQSHPMNQRLKSVHFLDAMTGWAASNALIEKTTDGGNSWTEPTSIYLEMGDVNSIYFINADTGWAAAEVGFTSRGAVNKTIDGGTFWSEQLRMPQGGSTLFDIYFSDVYTGWAVGSSGIYKTIDGGDNWADQTSGNWNGLHSVYFTDINTGWVVGANGTILHTTNGGVSFVEEEQLGEIPNEFLLSQNWPNPFNPNTKIKYWVPQTSQVQIKVYDILGNEIETLVNEEKHAGTYELNWNAASLPSGVYFYKLQSGQYTSVKKMILLK